MRCKYEQVAGDIREEIDSGVYEAGEALPPENELAERNGVSRMTLRKALDELTEEGRIIRRPGVGNFVSSANDRDRYLYIGPTHAHVQTNLHCSLIREAQRLGHSVSAYSTDEPDNDLADTDQVEDLIAGSAAVICETSNWKAVRPVVPEETTVVLVSGRKDVDMQELGTPAAYIVSADACRASEIATRHLIDLGHEEICYFGPGVGGYEFEKYRNILSRNPVYRAHLHALSDAGLESAGALGYPEKADDWQEASERFIRHFIDERGGWPTAFVCEGDFRASPLMRVALRDGLRLPEEMSIIGMCNTPWSQMLTPQLTSVSFQEREIARLAVDMCDKDRPETPQLIRVEPELVQRKSTTQPATRTETCAV